MLPTSQTYNDLIADPAHYFNVKVVIGGVTYGRNAIVSLQTQSGLFANSQPVVGSCVAGEIDLVMLTPTVAIPRMAGIEVYVQATDGTDVSEWIPQGMYYIDTREETKDDGVPTLTIHGYDAMLKTEMMFPGVTASFPMDDTDVVDMIASFIGVSVDARTYDAMTHSYQISAPVDYTMREVLSFIGSMYAGNWIITQEGKLLLVALNGIPEETSLLVDEAGNIITFGEDAISLVNI